MIKVKDSKKWYLCPNCGKKILIYDIKKAVSKGLYIKCKQCKREIEIKIH
jgi:transcription elongation factor Elf1